MELFLLPHQDDEFGVFHVIERTLEQERNLLIVYLTNGAYGNASAQIRSAESLRVLDRLGVKRNRILFLGQHIDVPNLGLRHRLDSLYNSLGVELQRHPPVTSIYTPAWEGGHPDHDAAALLAVALSHKLGVENIFQFPLYNADRWSPIRPFRVLAPIDRAGPIIQQHIPFTNRSKHLAMCWMYPSQKKTFIGLFPFVLTHYVRNGVQSLQRLSMTTLSQRPHDRALLYERRGWLRWEEFSYDTASFVRTYLH
jgi:LmbE family N-acetylglucosaminyl deacetylase